MIKIIDELLKSFGPCFSREASFKWFIIVVFGLIVRLDHNGVSSFIRCFVMAPNHYNSLLHFFKADSWDIQNISNYWIDTIIKLCPAKKIEGYTIILGDNIKNSKEARRMPAAKKLHQQSNNSNKPKYIFGHNFGVLSIVVGIKSKLFAIPFIAEIHEGVKCLHKFQDKKPPVVDGEEKTTIVTLMLNMAAKSVEKTGEALLVLDAFFPVKDTFNMAAKCIDGYGNRLLHIITRAKSNYVAFKVQYGENGELIKGCRLKLKKLFEKRKDEFVTKEIVTYGKKHKISYLCLDLIWNPINDILRFVLVIDGDERFILMSSNLELSPVNIIKAYSYRYKIELSFKYLKHLIGSFCYHFWTKAFSEFNKKKSAIDLSKITDTKKQKLIAQTVKSIEGFVLFGCIALGILQILSIKCPCKIWDQYTGWVRTKTSEIPSEGVVQNVIQSTYYATPQFFSNSLIFQVIRSKQRDDVYLYQKDAA